MTDEESHNIEYKRRWNDDCLKAIASMANASGGTLYLGLDDQGNPFELKNTKKLLEDIPNIIRNKLNILPSVELDVIAGHKIIRITVPQSSIPVSCNGKYYFRSGSTVQELRGKELSDFLLKKSGTPWDNSIEEQCDIKGLDPSTINEFKRLAADRLPGIVNETDHSTILDKLNLIQDNKLKRAVVLLFGSDPQRFYSHGVVKIGKFLTDTDIQTTDIVKGNLFRQLDDSLGILRTKYLQSNISYEGIHRRDILEYPDEALREAIINALIHRDYHGFSQIQIRVYPDKMIIMNEGSLPPEITIEDLKKNHLSKPRNKLLADIFYFAGFIEAWGRGTLKIIEKCRDQGLPEPEFNNEHGVMSITFYKDKWNEKDLHELGLNGRQIKAVHYIKEHGKITNSDYQKLNNVSERTALRDLDDLIQKEVVQKKGEKKGTHYQLVS
ncbi:transcriptional regulator [Candidatus Peregrinibacteria bacterium]|nr:transcriptional regulator [Candidatus Peregrinibacteria bacterium]